MKKRFYGKGCNSINNLCGAGWLQQNTNLMVLGRITQQVEIFLVYGDLFVTTNVTENCFHWRVGSGNDINMLADLWLSYTPLNPLALPVDVQPCDGNPKVSNFTTDDCWDTVKHNAVLPVEGV